VIRTIFQLSQYPAENKCNKTPTEKNYTHSYVDSEFRGQYNLPSCYTRKTIMFSKESTLQQQNVFGARTKISGGKARMSQKQCPSYLRQEGESCDAYSDRSLAWHRQSYPVHVGPCRYARATKPFRAEDVFTHIANCARPLTEDLAVWLEDLSERYPYEWAKVLAQVSCVDARQSVVVRAVCHRRIHCRCNEA
jgi:hypothetical protein